MCIRDRLRGRVLDVAVDIRFGSPTYGQFVMIELSAEHPQQFWIPCGFAHGFEVLENETDVYKRQEHILADVKKLS